MDRYSCSYMMLALLRARNVQVCARKHHARHTDFRKGRRLGQHDHLIVWTRPQRPDWMDEATDATIPETLTLREIRDTVVEKGRRTQKITVITTLTDSRQETAEDIAALYGFRWNAEVDIRSIKETLNLGHVRCKSPEMVGRELWTTLLADHLIRTTAAAAALVHDKQPRHIRFTATCQYVLSCWMLLSCQTIDPSEFARLTRTMREQVAACEVANRPGRLEPRVIKRRRHGYPLIQQLRSVLKTKLRKHCT